MEPYASFAAVASCVLALGLVSFRAAADGPAASQPSTAAAATSPWDIIKPHMSPPEKFKGQYGDFRDVMKFDDGSAVKTPADWPRRRAEILKYWHATMGPWAALIEKPKVEFKAKEEVENFTRHKIEMETAPGRMQECYLLVPRGNGPMPAVMVVWYNATESAGIPQKAGDPRPTWAFGYDLARRGFVTLCVGGPGGITQDKGIQPLSFAAYCAANACNALANMPEVDPKRIGVVGHSFGGKWAMFASCLHEKFAAAVWCDPGIVWNEKDANANYWEKWYLGAEEGKDRKPGVVTAANGRTGAYKTLVESGRDLHELHALMAPRPFLVSGGGQDLPEHWVPLNHSTRLYEFLGYKDRIGMTIRNGHTPTPQSNEQMYAFFEHFLKLRD